jgi:ABC-type transport system substrate-binding protein
MNRGHPDFDNLLVRQAIAHAIDRQALINNLTPDDLLAKQYLPPSIWGYDPDLQDYSYDPALSKQLLEQAGFTGTLYTTLSYLDVIRPYIPDQALIANQIAADLEEVGIHAELIGYESSTFLEKYNNGDFDLFLMGWIADYLHPDNFFSPVLCNPGVLGFGPLDIELCKNVQSALAEHDPDQQIIAFQAISQQVHYSLPLLPLAHTQAPLFYRAELGGLTPSPMGLEIYKDVYFVHPCFLPLVNR